jgi:hypothetical protein
MVEEMILEPEEREENPIDRLMGLKAEVNQMKAMIAENIRLIAEGDDVEGREFLKSHLEMEVLKKEKEIATLQEQINA